MATLIIDELLDLAATDEKVTVRLFQPVRLDPETWVCRFEVGAPIGAALDVQGESSLQAIALALQGLSASLYSSDVYRKGRLGAFGAFGGYLGLPAPSAYADFAPYPF